jgi:D-sedoheptulose 7-phosphate isomerase
METATTPFQSLKDFRTAVEGTRATDREGTEVPLIEGLGKAVQLIQEIDATGKKVVLIGNGGSAAIASHQAVDLWKNGGIRATAFNDSSLLTCIGNDFGYEHVFAKPIEMFCDTGDLVIAVSSSGKSANILNGVTSALTLGCKVIGFSGFKANNPLSAKCHLNFYLGSDSYGVVEVGHLLLLHSIIDEVIRLKASKTTSQRLTVAKRSK